MLRFACSWACEDSPTSHAKKSFLNVSVSGQHWLLHCTGFYPSVTVITVSLYVSHVSAILQMKSIEQQHSQVGTGDRQNLLVSLRDKELVMQANSLHLFSRRLQLLQEKKSMEVSKAAMYSDT